MMLVVDGGGLVNFEFVVVGNIEVVCVKCVMMKFFDFDDCIDDIFIMFDKQYYLICLVLNNDVFFIYVVIDKKVNLVMVCYVFVGVEKDFVI